MTDELRKALTTDEAIDLLTDGEGDTVAFCCKNPDFNGLPNECVVINASWTGWQDRAFRADTRAECLRLAIEAMRVAADLPPTQEPTKAADDSAMIEGMCLTWDHSYGLMTQEQRGALRQSMYQLYHHNVRPVLASEREARERAEERAHYATGTADLAMQHRDAAEATLATAREENKRLHNEAASLRATIAAMEEQSRFRDAMIAHQRTAITPPEAP